MFKSNAIFAVMALFIISIVITLNLFFQHYYIVETAQRHLELNRLTAVIVSERIERDMSYVRAWDYDSAIKTLQGSIKNIDRGLLPEGCYIWVADSEGKVLYHGKKKEMEGNSPFAVDNACHKCHKSFDSQKGILSSNAPLSGSFGDSDKITGFARVSVPQIGYVTIAVSESFEQAVKSAGKSVGVQSFLLLAVVLIMGGGAVTIVLLNNKRMHAVAEVRRQDDLKRYAEELEDTVKMKIEELRIEKEKLDAIVSALDVGVFVINHTGKVAWANSAFRQWFNEREIEGISLQEIYGGLEVTPYLAEGAGIKEIIHHRLGEREGYFQITSMPIFAVEGRMQMLGVVHDLTEIKKFEEQLSHSERLASVGRLSAGVAHEIGNPLTSVFSFLQILREMETDDFKIKTLDTVLFHIGRVADIVKQLSGFSRLAGPEMRPVRISEVIDSALGLMKFDKRAGDVAVKKEFGDIPAVVTDSDRLMQVFLNLTLNAVDAMPEGGVLTIRTYAKGDSIKIEFEDTGTGIEEDHVGKVFDPFFTTKKKGTGLGLSVSYGIIERLGGELSVTSIKDKGTRFTITLPMMKDE